ncbi:UDP-Glycosyltransferase superfamily protein [Abeliophyllum distichum]|uniref:UDP-Glycosyltransferase superfamily protein n=1 Tax=Abeliophyllum distichum TaxID=126358 RepID=A0ABD1Q8A2_9LAMI
MKFTHKQERKPEKSIFSVKIKLKIDLAAMVPCFRFRSCCYILVLVSSLSSISFLYWSYSSVQTEGLKESQLRFEKVNLLMFPSALNHLIFPSRPPPRLLKIALFVKKWPSKHQAGGLERHALTLHLALAKRGHELHIFTTSSSNLTTVNNVYFHLSKPTSAGYLDQALIWKQFQAVSWHGIAYESIHSDIIQELIRAPEEPQSYALTERVVKVVEEIKFFPHYAHHVATSDHVGDILKRVYMIPEEHVHIILNGVDEEIFKPDVSKGKDFKLKFGIPESKSIILGMAGRLVKDKGHPLMFEALRQIFSENSTFRDSVIVVIAGDGPWGDRYKQLGSNLLVLGPLEQSQLARFYNAIDIFVNPTLRAQGLDHTLLEAILTGKTVMATKLASITGSVIVSKDVGYTFPPTVGSLKKALYEVWKDGRAILESKGESARKRGLQLFTATKMAAAYERLFLCIYSNDYCVL